MPSLNLFGSFFHKRRGATYQQGRADYYKALNAISSIDSIEVLKKIKFSASRRLSVPVRCFGIVFAVNEKQVRQKLGKPNYRQQSVLGIPALTTLFYKLKIKGIRCVLEIHFYQNAVFCLHLLMKGGTSDERNAFLASLARLYQQKNIQWGDLFLGQNKNVLRCENDVMPRITYLSGDPNCLDSILAETQPKEQVSRDDYSIRKLDWRMT